MTALLARLEMLSASFGQTPVVRLADDTVDLYAKLEFANPNGSTKDRSAYWILKRAIERGDVTEHTTVVESSSGNFAISMASFCQALGIRFVPVIDPNCNAPTEAYLRTICERVVKVEEPDGSGGFLRTRLERVESLRAELAPVYWPNQYTNPDALEAHYRMTGGELCGTFRNIDYVFVGVSTGGTVAGVSRRLKESFPNITVVAVDAAGSAIFGRPPSTRRIPGLGSSVVPDLCRRAEIDDVVIVPERQAVASCHELFQRHGLYAGGSTGSVYAAIRSYFERFPPPGSRPTVVFLCADRGASYAHTIYNPTWVREHLDDESAGSRPIVLPKPVGRKESHAGLVP
ncbi:2,3-diaminopropionate biosynthesis protein SbnA [Streptomyces atratus]|uniref:Cysteine synthase A n=1 Tax=Streptomyces atratus TaxID=1893 RepID=A0A1K2B3Y6_STRAR|nr:2,3-diaminopropionate biosynthesis protein SbnA [Streptomyces atratus]SFX93329.1 cysteine synthase A [Streptomyces atratus]